MDKKDSGPQDTLSYLCAGAVANGQSFMLILLDCRPLQSTGSEGEKRRLIASAIAALPGDKAVEWLLLTDHTFKTGVPPELAELLEGLPGARQVTVRGLPGPVGWRLWYDWQVPRLIRRYKPHLVVLTGGVTVRSGPARQWLWMPEHADPKEAAGDMPPLYASRLGESVRQAEKIFCFSENDRSWLTVRGGIDAAKIVVVRPSASPAIQPLTVSDKEKIKHRYTEGKEFFFISAAGAREADVIQLLKAFSLFKKRQLSNLRLVISGIRSQALREQVETYKYRGDVVWADADADELMTAAYAVLFLFEDGLLGMPLLNAWKAGVPAMVARNTRLREMADEDALVPGVDDPAALAGHMMAIYKDETLRNALIQKGALRLTAPDITNKQVNCGLQFFL